jgi:hypothetical protein
VKLTKVDKLTLQNLTHWHLDENDECYFFGEYTARRGFNFSDTNQLIYNFKKGLEKKRNSNEWRYSYSALTCEK